MFEVMYFGSFIIGGLLAYTVAIVLVSLLVHRLQKKSSGLPTESENWDHRPVDPASLINSQFGADDIPVATVAADQDASDNEDKFDEASRAEIEGSYQAPPPDLILAYNNIDSIEYRPISFLRAGMIALLTSTVAIFVGATLLTVFYGVTMIFGSSSPLGSGYVLPIVLIVFFFTSLLLRILVQKSSFGPTSLAVATETVLFALAGGILFLLS